MSQADINLMNSLVEIQRAYWKPNSVEKASLLSRYPQALSWAETFRLLHLACMELLDTPEGRAQWLSTDSGPGEHHIPTGETYNLCQSLARRLMDKESPYRPRVCDVWQGAPGTADNREPELQGFVRNASLTHLGSLEVIHTVEQEGTPTELSFIPFDDIQAIIFSRPSSFRAAMVHYDDGRPPAVVWVPLLYGISWATTNTYDHDGTLTRFCCHVKVAQGERSVAIGIGHQDFELIDPAQNQRVLLGVGSLGQVGTLLEDDDPKLERKLLARGMSPADVKQFIERVRKNRAS
jgi:hypothetical protein